MSEKSFVNLKKIEKWFKIVGHRKIEDFISPIKISNNSTKFRRLVKKPNLVARTSAPLFGLDGPSMLALRATSTGRTLSTLSKSFNSGTFVL